MRYPSTCFVGRIIIRDDRVGGLEWNLPCPVPAENHLDCTPPMYFCSPHFNALSEDMFAVLDRLGLIDHNPLVGPETDVFEELAIRLRDPEHG